MDDPYNHLMTNQMCISTTEEDLGKVICLQMYKSQHMSKPTQRHVHLAKTQISLGICTVWSESSLSAWIKLGSLATHWAHSEDWSDWAVAQADLSLP